MSDSPFQPHHRRGSLPHGSMAFVTPRSSAARRHHSTLRVWPFPLSLPWKLVLSVLMMSIAWASWEKLQEEYATASPLHVGGLPSEIVTSTDDSREAVMAQVEGWRGHIIHGSSWQGHAEAFAQLLAFHDRSQPQPSQDEHYGDSEADAKSFYPLSEDRCSEAGFIPGSWISSAAATALQVGDTSVPRTTTSRARDLLASSPRFSFYFGNGKKNSNKTSGGDVAPPTPEKSSLRAVPPPSPPSPSLSYQHFGSATTQQIIYQHQHPQTCQDQRFLVFSALPPALTHGIGSVMHIFTVALAYAMQSERILIMAPQPDHLWSKGKHCEGLYTWDSCYFHPITNCTLNDALGSVPLESLIKVNSRNRFSEHLFRRRVVHASAAELPVWHPWHSHWGATAYPRRFDSLLASSGLSGKNKYYWWRAQGIAYFVRPNARTLLALEALRAAIFPGGVIPPGTISVHVRKGDKWKETILPEDPLYFEIAKRLQAAYPTFLTRTIFLSTESMSTFEYFIEHTRGVQWEVLTTHADRYDDPKLSPGGHGEKIGMDMEFLSSLVNLDLAVRCDAWVCLFESNWCRLIDEIRSTVRCKSHLPLYALGHETGIENFDW